MTDNTPTVQPRADAGRLGGLDIVSLIALTHSRVIRPFERRFARRFTSLQIMTLCMLMQSGPRSITDIASELCLSKQQTAKLVAKLHLRGCVRRFHPSDDHRVVLVELSDDTARMMEEQRGIFYSRLTERIAEHGDQAAVERFNEAVEQIRQVLALLPADSVYGRASADEEQPGGMGADSGIPSDDTDNDTDDDI